jgi:flagellar motility protein MotE (MotC chaperone)
MIAMRRGPVRGVLFFLAGLMLASGAIRVGLGLSTARAVTPPEVAATPDPAPPPAACPAPPEVLAQALARREAAVATREAALEGRLAALALAEEAVAARLRELEAAEARLSATIAQADGAAEGDLTRLTAVYEAMKPKEAAALFETMAPDFAAGFLGRMRPEAAAAVLSGMTPDAAYTVSVLLAGRNATAPRD